MNIFRQFLQYLRIRRGTFWYNFTWDTYSRFLNGTAARLSLLVPIFGYAVLFNDYVAARIEFTSLTNEVRTTLFLDPNWRIRLVFFGLLFLAGANAVYRLRRPLVIRLGETEPQFIDYFLRYATPTTFLRLHQDIHSSGYDPFTQDGKYYTDDWDLFWREARWSLSGKNALNSEDYNQDLPGYQSVNFAEAKRKHEGLLISILRETYFREGRKRRVALIVSILLAAIGYTLLAIPSIDLTG